MLILSALLITGCNGTKNTVNITSPQTLKTSLIKTTKPLHIDYLVTGSLLKQLNLTITNPSNYATLDLYANDVLLFENLNIAGTGKHTFNALVEFPQHGDTILTLKVNNTDITVHSVSFVDIADLTLPAYQDITKAAGLDSVNSIKYGGPTVADLDNDGDYDFIVNNHNQESSKLYWNNGDGTVTKHDKNLARWFMHDLHGTAVGDYDNDGDLDLVVTQGGGNGKNPSKANFYTNNNSTLVLTTGDVNIDKGVRGRGAKWSDMDLDGDLDLILINEASLAGTKPQHYFYENTGKNGFVRKRVKGIEDQHPSRALVTDINNDHIDDIILYGPLSVWQGNGDFTFTNVTAQFPKIIDTHSIMAVTDIDIDNDGDLDLYLARGKEFEAGKGEAPFVDHNPLDKTFSIKPRGYKGIDKFTFTAENQIKLHNYYYLAQGAFRGKDYPLFLGRNKTPVVLKNGGELTFTKEQAQGFTDDMSENGVYFGHIGNGQWQAALVRNDDIFWGYKFSLKGVDNLQTAFTPENRNMADILLRNDNGTFTDVSKQWNIPLGGNSMGVTRGDFNNDTHQDLFIYRWGDIEKRIADLMLVNNGNGQFHAVTAHGANASGDHGNGDMGQAFDFDLDGDIDLLNGSEGGQWYLYANSQNEASENNYVLINVGYSPKNHIDATSALVTVETVTQTFHKRVGSAGAVFSQSLLNTVHFGLAKENTIKKITVRWRNGETVEFSDKAANQVYSTSRLDPTTITLIAANESIRAGTKMTLIPQFLPKQSNQTLHWSSSNEAILTVNQAGKVKAVGKPTEYATIRVTSAANQLVAEKNLHISEFVPAPLTQITITADDNNAKSSLPHELFVGQSLQLSAKLTPGIADNQQITWQSNKPAIAIINNKGQIKALESGTVTLSALGGSNNQVIDSYTLVIKPVIKPYITITNQSALNNLTVGDDITVRVDYHAGSNNQVIASDEGGIRFWLRHFKSKWIPVKDTVLTDKSVLNTQSGQSSMTFSLDGVIPSAELPEGHFYLLRASFVSSDGTMNDVNIYPLNISESHH
ncbi:FG-GAP-like repeat-containing protein [Pseudoalteromonas sp. Hal273]